MLLQSSSRPSRWLSLLCCIIAIGLVASQEDDQPPGPFCVSSSNTFTVRLNLFASELGYFTFEECGDVINPTIVMEVGQTYTFLQSDRSNYYHPMGFAYFPDGALADREELEPSIAMGSDTSCSQNQTCPAPMYFLNEEYLGDYSNQPRVQPRTTGTNNFGLDEYEPLFMRPLPEWTALGDFSIRLKFDDTSYEQDLFYFCHIHQFMSGRIKLTQKGVLVSDIDAPSLGYEYDTPGEFDQQCGTFGLDNFQLPNAQCPDRFVCDPPPENQPFADCIDAMNCYMMAGMTTNVDSRSNIALFVHQMIPHHQNAVNMAKLLLGTDEVPCDDLSNEEDPYCILQVILREIINGQNKQIQQMRGILDTLGLPDEDDCVVPIDNSPPVIGFQSDTPNNPKQEQESPEPQEPFIGFQSDTPNDPQPEQESPEPQPTTTTSANTMDKNQDPVIGFQQTTPTNPQEQEAPAPPPTDSTNSDNNAQRPVGQQRPVAGNANRPSGGGGGGNGGNKQSNNGFSDDSGGLSGFNPGVNSFDEDSVSIPSQEEAGWEQVAHNNIGTKIESEPDPE